LTDQNRRTTGLGSAYLIGPEKKFFFPAESKFCSRRSGPGLARLSAEDRAALHAQYVAPAWFARRWRLAECDDLLRSLVATCKANSGRARPGASSTAIRRAIGHVRFNIRLLTLVNGKVLGVETIRRAGRTIADQTQGAKPVGGFPTAEGPPATGWALCFAKPSEF
jgi:hypothetical protein